ncbi:MAG: hypothetical protein OEY32_15510, partial [Candidatus Krumholzibacteria bacterium]|nr:hypothetical protein [Candidatus Krumholzibacteria bacterium]
PGHQIVMSSSNQRAHELGARRVEARDADFVCGRGVRVFNIEVDGNHAFYAGGVLVHNKKDPNEP